MQICLEMVVETKSTAFCDLGFFGQDLMLVFKHVLLQKSNSNTKRKGRARKAQNRSPLLLFVCLNFKSLGHSCNKHKAKMMEQHKPSSKQSGAHDKRNEGFDGVGS